MKKIILIFLFGLFSFSVFSQVGYNLSFNNLSYHFRTDNAAIRNISFSYNFEIGYYFKNSKGVFTGAYLNDKFFIQQTDTIFSSYVQIPFMFSQKVKIANSPIGLSSSIGYLLSVPYNINSSNNNVFDIGLIHGLLFNFTIDVWMSEHVKLYTGFNSSYDLYNKNNIKFSQYGTVFGIGVYF